MATPAQITLLARLTAAEMLVTQLLARLPDDEFERLRESMLADAKTNSIRGVDAAQSDHYSGELQRWLEQAFLAVDQVPGRDRPPRR